MIAIHQREGSFSDKWIEYCYLNKIEYKLVNCYSRDIIHHLKDCDGLMWHWTQLDHKAALFAKQFIVSLERMGKKVFPDFNTCWHFDDKVGQKYLLEAIGAPLVPSYVFYDEEDAFDWAKETEYPKVFKLRGGAGSENVKIVYNYNDAKKLIRKAFGKGFKPRNRLNFLRERIWHYRRDKNLVSLLNITKGVGRLFIPSKAELKFGRERNYVYLQDFISGNDHDIRVIVIGRRAFAIKRLVRKDDFRASGSGRIVYDPSQIPEKCLRISFDLSDKLNAQCLAYDFVFKNGNPLLLEISYGFAREGYLSCQGYWDNKLVWKEGLFTPEYFMIKDFLDKLG